MNYRIFENLLDGAVVVDENDRILYANSLAIQWGGGSLRRFRQKPKFQEMFHLRRPPFDGELKDIKMPTDYLEIELDLGEGVPSPDNLMLMQVSVQPEEEQNNKRWIYFIRNNTLETRLRSKYLSEQHAKQHFRLAAETDALTGISNKKYFQEKLLESFRIAKQNESTFSLIFFDLDNFKKLNDTYGHFAGDFVLKECARIIENELLRSGDIFARFGGEEFVIMLKRCELEDAVRVAERIRSRIDEHDFQYDGHKLQVTISVGVGEVESAYSSAEEFMKRVDEASYVSKRSGKNKVTAVPHIRTQSAG